MASIIILDVTFVITLLVLLVGFIWFRVSYHTWLKEHGTNVVALVTQVRKDNRTLQTCHVTATWTDTHTGCRCTFQGYRFDLGYRAGQLVGIRLDPKRPTHYIMEK